MEENKLTFEEAYKQLMELVKKMESGELPLADSVAAYENCHWLILSPRTSRELN